ncbi:deaminase [Pseudarthrobacter sp. NamE2]|uniref:dihydrofolate reductase family protein n=1 Tax=Pseudarthrobacter sp. NamE2 TaxID=2576838 RepID=UPI0010FE0C66|nr:dihydrofolate reductase family protein [Pseudarthrobacter sp. NamE2]TLM83675.1 deaminase [Pseudarthrobacter sp. NamE2]
MRTVIVSNIVSLDGFYAAPNGSPLVLNMDEAFDEYNRERIEAADIVLLGRNSFEGFSAYWPNVANAPADPGNRALSENNRRISSAYNSLCKVVVSDNLKISPDNPWAKSTTVIPRTATAAWLEAAQNEGDRDILIFASRIMWNGLLSRDLIDELHLMVSPAALVEGVPIFDVPASLNLMDSRRFPNSNNVLLRYSTRGHLT